MNQPLEAFRTFCIRAVLAVVGALVAVFAVCSLGMTAQLVAHEHIDFIGESFLWNIAATAALIAVLCALYRLPKRALRMVLGLSIFVLSACSVVFLLGAKTQQMYDFAYVTEAAQLFARGNYKAMETDYFHVCSYQLGICLPMEILLRMLPGIDLNLFMQVFEVVLALGCIGLLCVLANNVFAGRQIGEATVLVAALFLPVYMVPVFVYSTIPMLFLALLSLCCFERYMKKRTAVYGWGFAVCMAAAYMLKPNAAILLMALCICAMLDFMRHKDWKILGYACMAVVLAVALARGVIWQYELRSGIKLTENVSVLARFVMGLQEGGGAAGWYNCYIDQFFPFDVTPEQEKNIVLADLAARVQQMMDNPGMTFAFYRDKLLSQWLEPTCGVMWYGNLCEQHGPLAEVARKVYAQGSVIRALLEGYMGLFQQGLYALAFLGIYRAFRCKPGVPQMMPALCVMGGCMYHLLFEAKSQYAFIYLLFLLPYAAAGLDMLSGIRCKKK